MESEGNEQEVPAQHQDGEESEGLGQDQGNAESSAEGGTGDPPVDPDNQGPSGPPHGSIPGGDVD